MRIAVPRLLGIVSPVVYTAMAELPHGNSQGAEVGS